MANMREQLERALEQEVDRRFEFDILDRLRGKRLSPLAKKKAEKVEEAVDEGMSDEQLAMLQALDQGDNEASA